MNNNMIWFFLFIDAHKNIPKIKNIKLVQEINFFNLHKSIQKMMLRKAKKMIASDMII